MKSSPSFSVVTIDDLRGPAGRLEALLNPGVPDAPYAVLLCHPHPLGGGTMHNKVVYHAMKAFQSLGLPVLRFNFRGTGLSEGTHDYGQGEQDDARAALDWLERRYGLPILFAGFSFGSYVGSRACCGDARVKGAVLLGAPAHAEGRDYDFGFLSTCTIPKLFISGTRDQYGPVDTIQSVVAHAAPPSELVLVEGADHFFVGRLDEVQHAIIGWTRSHFLDAALP
ncbi:alpha/beta hydrolase [Silvibacterium dinghuense]|uniref:Alpha/beta hydrolase n=1 Tax=Silvibacterium dinghuense TaxID=1560006 RepID=A0A4V1NVG8_9BACT|nr:alpha/beta hydrolase [Silvibacterium dinghuense]